MKMKSIPPLVPGTVVAGERVAAECVAASTPPARGLRRGLGTASGKITPPAADADETGLGPADRAAVEAWEKEGDPT